MICSMVPFISMPYCKLRSISRHQLLVPIQYKYASPETTPTCTLYIMNIRLCKYPLKEKYPMNNSTGVPFLPRRLHWISNDSFSTPGSANRFYTVHNELACTHTLPNTIYSTVSNCACAIILIVWYPVNTRTHMNKST